MLARLIKNIFFLIFNKIEISKNFIACTTFAKSDIKIVMVLRNTKKGKKSYTWYVINLGKRTLQYRKFNHCVHFFCSRPVIPFFGPKKIKTVSLSCKLVSKLIRICKNQCWCSLFFVFDGNYPFWEKMVPKF